MSFRAAALSPRITLAAGKRAASQQSRARWFPHAQLRKGVSFTQIVRPHRVVRVQASDADAKAASDEAGTVPAEPEVAAAEPAVAVADPVAEAPASPLGYHFFALKPPSVLVASAPKPDAKDVDDPSTFTLPMLPDILADGATIVVGSASTCDLVIPHAAVKEKHATLTVVDGELFVKDETSGDTLVYSAKTYGSPAGESKLVKPGQFVEFGSKFCRYELRLPSIKEQMMLGRLPDNMEVTANRSTASAKVNKQARPFKIPDCFELVPVKEVLESGESELEYDYAIPSAVYLPGLDDSSTTLTVGADAACDITLPVGTVSGSHAKIEFKGGMVFVTDLESTNGTRVTASQLSRGKDLIPNVPMRMASGDTVNFGGAKFKLENVKPLEGLEEGDVKVCGKLNLVPTALKVLGKAQKASRGGEGVDDSFTLPQIPQMQEGKAVTIGADEGCDIVIPMKTVSGTHAKFDMEDGRLYVTDLTSSNGTYVGATRMLNDLREVANGDRVEVPPGYFVQIGSKYAVYQYTRDRAVV